MIEIPEAQTLASQLDETITGKTIKRAVAAQSPHGFAFYFGDPGEYAHRLQGRLITATACHGGHPEIWAEDMRLCFSDGVNVRYLTPGAKSPDKHQLLLIFDDDSSLHCTISMYGGIWAFPDGLNDNPYYLAAKQKPSPLDDRFDTAYFQTLLTPETAKLSAKAFLATQQRIPGLGNGVLQDILWTAKIHPKQKLCAVTDRYDTLHSAVKSVLAEMTTGGGRSTDKDLFGDPGGYQTILSRFTVGQPCPRCGTLIQRLSYLGGNVYVCRGCQTYP